MASKTDALEEIAAFAGLTLSAKEFKLFQALVYQLTGISLGDNKSAMLAGRLSKRVRELGLPSFQAYYHLVKRQGPESDELRQLVNRVTTNKTAFFREKHHFEFLTSQLKQRSANTPLRIWSAACSTGEEPYSIAMTVADALSPVRGKDIRILASDVDTQVLHAAEQGVYDASSLADIPAEFQKRYLLPEQRDQQAGFRVKQEPRDLITFRHKNLVAASWAINTTFDFIFCRNVLIYFDHKTQDKILRKFIALLKPSAYLIIGHSEHVHWLDTLIEPVGYTIYRVRSKTSK